MILQVPEELDGQRVDKVLAVLLGVSRAEARSLVDRGVKLNGVPVTGSERVRAGSQVDTPGPLVAGGLEREDVGFGVVHEDRDLIVVDKPSGVVVHPGAGHATGTLAAGLLFRYPELEGVGAAGRWGLVHRLDRDTSGLLLVARNQRAFETLASALARREITRSYLALVRGAMDIETGTIDAPIGRDPAHPTRRAVLSGGKPAVTHYRLIKDYAVEDLALLDVTLDTGRTHQIRVHMAAIEHPVLGDPSYGRPGPGVVAPRVFLHAHRLALRHPDTGHRVEFESPLPDDLRRVLEQLGGPVPQ
ncbi:MAG: RluA family pseudouridine synthase [Acidimicrobiia bacterium]